MARLSSFSRVPASNRGAAPARITSAPAATAMTSSADLPRAGDQLDVTEHSTFDVEIAEPRSENRHLGPT